MLSFPVNDGRFKNSYQLTLRKSTTIKKCVERQRGHINRETKGLRGDFKHEKEEGITF